MEGTQVKNTLFGNPYFKPAAKVGISALFIAIIGIGAAVALKKAGFSPNVAIGGGGVSVATTGLIGATLLGSQAKKPKIENEGIAATEAGGDPGCVVLRNGKKTTENDIQWTPTPEEIAEEIAEEISKMEKENEELENQIKKAEHYKVMKQQRDAAAQKTKESLNKLMSQLDQIKSDYNTQLG